jgi:hypothetical protein
MLGLRRGVGGNIASLEHESEAAANVTGRYVSQQCQYALVSFESHATEFNKNFGRKTNIFF